MKAPLLLLMVILSISLSSFALADQLQLSLTNEIIQGEDQTASAALILDQPIDGYITLSYTNLQSSTSTIQVNSGSFTGSGPYTFTHLWSVSGGSEGDYTLSATATHSNLTTIVTASTSGKVNSSAPKVLTKLPSGVVTGSTATLEITTNERATCKYDTTNTTYDAMGTLFDITDSTFHQHTVSELSENTYTYYIRCRDTKGYTMEVSEVLTFRVDLPPTARISLNKDQPLSKGTIEVEVITSENLPSAPFLEYSFNDAPTSKQLISLTGSGTQWSGYLILTESHDNKVGTFYFTGKDSRGSTGTEITQGKIFLVDTSSPPAPVDLESTVQSDGSVLLKWFYDGEIVLHYNIYRSTSSGVSPIDLYVTTSNSTQFRDRSTSNQVTYYYKVAAVDQAGNVGSLSAEVYGTSLVAGKENSPAPAQTTQAPDPEPKELPPNLVLTVNDAIKRAQQAQIDVGEIVSSLNKLTNDERAILTQLGILPDTTLLTTTINTQLSDLEALKNGYRSESEINSKIQTIESAIATLKSSTVKGITIEQKAEYLQSTSKEDLQSSIEVILGEYDESFKKEYLKNNVNIQEEITIETQLYNLNIEYGDASSTDKTLVSKKIAYHQPDPLGDVLIVDNIPTDAISDLNEIVFLSTGQELLDPNPLVKWGVLSLDFEGTEIIYSIDRKVPLDDLKLITTSVLAGPAQFAGQEQIVGFSVFSFVKDIPLSGTEKFFVTLGFFIIISMVVYYNFFMKGSSSIPLFPKQPKSYPKGMSLSSEPTPSSSTFDLIQAQIQHIEQELSADNFDKAADLYPAVMIHYTKLSKDQKPLVYPKCVELQKIIKEKQEEFMNGIES